MTSWILAAFVLACCFAADRPFYENRDVIVDDRIVGVYPDADTGTLTTLTKTKTRGRYRAVLQEKGSRSLYVVIPFRIGNSTFLDISADAAPPVHTPGAEKGAVTEIMLKLTSGRKHVVLRAAPQNDRLVVWIPTLQTLNALLAARPELNPRTEHQILRVFPEPTRTLRQLLVEHGQDGSLFDQEAVLIKRR